MGKMRSFHSLPFPSSRSHSNYHSRETSLAIPIPIGFPWDPWEFRIMHTSTVKFVKRRWLVSCCCGTFVSSCVATLKVCSHLQWRLESNRTRIELEPLFSHHRAELEFKTNEKNSNRTFVVVETNRTGTKFLTTAQESEQNESTPI